MSIVRPKRTDDRGPLGSWAKVAGHHPMKLFSLLNKGTRVRILGHPWGVKSVVQLSSQVAPFLGRGELTTSPFRRGCGALTRARGGDGRPFDPLATPLGSPSGRTETPVAAMTLCQQECRSHTQTSHATPWGLIHSHGPQATEFSTLRRSQAAISHSQCTGVVALTSEVFLRKFLMCPRALPSVHARIELRPLPNRRVWLLGLFGFLSFGFTFLAFFAARFFRSFFFLHVP